MIKRPSGRRTGNTHRCLQRALRIDAQGNWRCIDHAYPSPPVSPSEDTPSYSTPERPSLAPVYRQRRSSSSTTVRIERLYEEATRSTVRSSPFARSPPPDTSGLVSRITNAISSLSSVLASPADASPVRTAAPPTRRTSTGLDPLPISAPVSLRLLNRFSTMVDTQCSICLESHDSMRRLDACGHMFCGDCLLKQVRSSLAKRYCCALCRKHMLSAKRHTAGEQWLQEVLLRGIF